MLDDLLLLPFEAGVEWFIGRDEARTTVQRLCLFVGIVGLLLAVAVAVTSGPWDGLAVAIVGGALFVYGA